MERATFTITEKKYISFKNQRCCTVVIDFDDKLNGVLGGLVSLYYETMDVDGFVSGHFLKARCIYVEKLEESPNKYIIAFKYYENKFKKIFDLVKWFLQEICYFFKKLKNKGRE